MLVDDFGYVGVYVHVAVVEEEADISIHWVRRRYYWRLMKKVLFAERKKNHCISDRTCDDTQSMLES